MNKGGVLLFVFLLLMATQADLATAKKNAKFNSSSGCGCHSGGANGVNAILSGLPSSYTPATTYSLSIGMSGNPLSGGFNLEVSKGALSNPSGAAQVSSNGFQATHNTWTSTSWTVDWTAPASGSGTVQVNLAVLHGNNGQNTGGDLYGTSSTSVSEDINTNTPPTATNLNITPSTPTTSEDLTLTYTYADDDGDAQSGTTVSWHRNGVAQPEHTSTILPATATAKGEAWHAVVTPSDGEDAGTSVASSSVFIINSAPTITSVAVSSETPDTNDDVTFTYQTDDVDGDTITTTETRWLLEGAVFSSLDNASTLPAVATRVGDTWTVEVRISDGEAMSDWFASTAMVVGSSNQAPVVDSVVVTPTDATTLDDLTAAWTTTDLDGDEIADAEVMWMKDGIHQTDVDGVNPLPANRTSKGDAWTAFVRVSDGEAWSLTTSSAQQTIGNAAPTVVSAVLTSPSFSANDPLSVNVTAEDPDGEDVQVVDVRWYLNDVEQSDGTNSLVLNSASLQRGDAWHAVITMSDGSDQTTAMTSSATIVNAAPEVNIAWPSEANALQNLVPVIAVTDADGDAASFTTTWYKNGFRDAGLANATSVPAEKLAPGQTWKLVVEASDGELTTSRQASTVLENLPPVAEMTLVSSAVWFNETTVLSAEASTDLDGELVQFTWSWDGATATGASLELVLTKDTEVHLLVSDDLGATAETTLQLTVSTGPAVQNLRVFNDGNGKVDLTWEWNGEAVEFNIHRNGQFIATTNSQSYQDLPPMSGVNTYTVQPVNDERTFLNGADGIATTLQPIILEEPGPATGLGLGLGILMLLGMLIPLFFAGRKGGDA